MTLLGALILTCFYLTLIAGIVLTIKAGQAGRDAWRAIRRR